MEAFLYEGIPTSEEIRHRLSFGNTQMGFMHTCPNIDCMKSNSQFLRETFWLCHSCGRLFTTQDAMKFLNERSETLDKYGFDSVEFSKYRSKTRTVISKQTSINQIKKVAEFNSLKQSLGRLR